MEVRELKNDENIICPFCRHILLESGGKSPLDPCKHTILVATGGDVEMANDEFVDVEALERIVDEQSVGYDKAILMLDLPGTILIKQYHSAPTFFEAYHLFKGE